jgi:flagellar protein FlgJ
MQAAAANFDPRALDALRAQARSDPPSAARAAAQHFEAVFLGMLLASLRASLEQQSEPAGADTRLYWSLFDQQVAALLARRGTGLGAHLARALEGAAAPQAAAPPAAPAEPAPVPLPAPAAPSEAGAKPFPIHAREFAVRFWPHALEAARLTGIAPHFILAQAALESNWGRAEPRGPDGTPSYNLFGIKAGRDWAGAVLDAQTTEYVAGVPQRTSARFRAYGSYAEAFLDYARLLRSSPRYAEVLRNGHDARAFAHALAQAGYATDPAYGQKLVRVIESASLRAALAG